MTHAAYTQTYEILLFVNTKQRRRKKMKVWGLKWRALCACCKNLIDYLRSKAVIYAHVAEQHM